MTATLESLPQKGTRKLPILLLILSVAVNVFLGYHLYSNTYLGSLYGQVRGTREKIISKYRSWPTWLTDLRPTVSKETMVETALHKDSHDQLPRFRSKLSHLLFALRDTTREIDQLRRTMELWTDHPPCLVDSIPTSQEHSDIVLVFYFDSSPRDKTVSRIRSLIKKLPQRVSSCFSSVEMRHANLKRLSPHASVTEERSQWRNVFEGLVTNQADFTELNHVAILTSECRPVQADWLNQLDYQTRPPNDQVWMRGSIYRGILERPPMDLGQLIRLSPAGLYFFADQSFAEFYLTRVKPWIANQTETIPPNNILQAEDNDRWAVDFFQYLASQVEDKAWFPVAHHFRHTNLIGDYHGRNVSISYLEREQPDTVLVCGNVIP